MSDDAVSEKAGGFSLDQTKEFSDD